MGRKLGVRIARGDVASGAPVLDVGDWVVAGIMGDMRRALLVLALAALLAGCATKATPTSSSTTPGAAHSRSLSPATYDAEVFDFSLAYDSRAYRVEVNRDVLGHLALSLVGIGHVVANTLSISVVPKALARLSSGRAALRVLALALPHSQRRPTLDQFTEESNMRVARAAGAIIGPTRRASLAGLSAFRYREPQALPGKAVFIADVYTIYHDGFIYVVNVPEPRSPVGARLSEVAETFRVTP